MAIRRSVQSLLDNPAQWPADWREMYDERVGMIQHHGGKSALYATIHAEAQVRAEHRRAAKGKGFVDELKRLEETR